jgi:hypothetical protein
MVSENAISSQISSILSKYKLTHIINTDKLRGFAAENVDFLEYLAYLKHVNNEETGFMNHLMAVPGYHLCELAKKGINIDMQTGKFMMELMHLKGIARVKAIEATYNCIIFGGIHNKKFIVKEGLAKYLVELAAGDESEMLCYDCELPAVIFALLQDDNHKSALLELGVTKALINYLHHECDGPARSYALKSITDLSYHPEYHAKLVTDGVLQTVCELYPYNIFDSDSVFLVATTIWNVVKSGKKDSEIFLAALSSLSKFVEHEEASIVMCDVIDHNHLDDLLKNLGDGIITCSLKNLLHASQSRIQTGRTEHTNTIKMLDGTHDAATEFAQNAEKDVLIRMELRLKYLEDQLSFQQLSLKRDYDRKLQEIKDVITEKVDRMSEKLATEIDAFASRITAVEQRVQQVDTSTAMDIMRLKKQLEESQSQMKDLHKQVVVDASNENSICEESEQDLSFSTRQGTEFPLKVESVQYDHKYASQASQFGGVSTRRETVSSGKAVNKGKLPSFMFDERPHDTSRRSWKRNHQENWRETYLYHSRNPSPQRRDSKHPYLQHNQSRKFIYPGAGSQSVYGDAKPVDTSIKDRHIEERLLEERKHLMKQLGLKSHYSIGKFRKNWFRADDWHLVTLAFPRSTATHRS